MPVQTQMSSFAKRLGGRVAQANAEHANKPVDTGNRRLPGGIRNGIAKLSAMYTKQQMEDNAKTPKGETFFRASAVVMTPEVHNGERIAGMVTQVVIPLCDVPAKGQRKATSFSENWYDFQNLFKLLGIMPPNETQQTDPTGQRTEAYYFAAVKTLCDPQRPPVYIEFSTRGWTPPPTPLQPKPEEMVFETWHGLASFKPHHDPAAAVTETNGIDISASQPEPFTEPPIGQVVYPHTQTASQRGAAPPPFDGPPPQYQPGGDPDPADVVAALVEVALNDPEGATEEGASASAQLEEMAWAAGWTKEQTAGAADWGEVGNMCLSGPETASAPAAPVVPTVGMKAKFAKRSKDGAKLRNNKGEEFPPQEVEVVTVDVATKTCTVKTVKDGKDVVDIRSKKPVAVKFEWLE